MSQQRDNQTDLEEYEFLYIAPPKPSPNWSSPDDRIRWTNRALGASVALLLLACLLVGFMVGRWIAQ